MKVVPSYGKRPKTSLRKTSIQKYEIPQNCPFSLPFLTSIAFRIDRVKKISADHLFVDRIKINSEQLFPFSESELSHTFCKFQV